MGAVVAIKARQVMWSGSKRVKNILHDATVATKAIESGGHWSAANHEMSPETDLDPHPVRAKRILLVDDEALVLDSTRMLLELDDHEVLAVESGERALELFQTGAFDLVITDFRMGGMDGGELTRKLKAIAPLQPVIILTAWPRDVDGCEPPPDLVIAKPYTLAELRRSIGKLLT